MNSFSDKFSWFDPDLLYQIWSPPSCCRAEVADPFYHGVDLAKEGGGAMMDEEVGQLAAQPWYGQGQGEGEISALVRSAARDCQGDSQRLLSLLRLLESLHREIRIHQFEPSLPQTRNALYQLLRDMEETGGWPYIERMRLQTFLNYFQLEESRHERGNFPE